MGRKISIEFEYTVGDMVKVKKYGIEHGVIDSYWVRSDGSIFRRNVMEE